MANSRIKGSGGKSIITKDIDLKIENFIKEDDLLNLEDIKKYLKKVMISYFWTNEQLKDT